MNQVIVIGAGASGMMAAITAAQNGAKVTLLEKMEKSGKKLLITGNGRCNITNSDYSRTDCYRSDDMGGVWQALSHFTYRQTLDFFEQLGLLVHEKNGYYYPVSNQAASVLEILMQAIQRLSIKLKYNEKVTSIEKEKEGWTVRTDTWQYHGDKVIIAVGSKAAPVTGADEAGYDLIKKLGLHLTDPVPALVPLKCNENWIKKMAGVRMPANIRLQIAESDHKNVTYQESGEIQWTEYGISGIAVFQLSRYAVLALKEGKKVSMQLDLLPLIDEQSLTLFIEKHLSFRKMEDILVGLLPKKLIPILIEQLKSKLGKNFHSEIKLTVRTITELIKHFQIQITGSKSFEMAQVCAGGVFVNEIDPETMQCRRFPDLYLTGEVLNVDGVCGGYNLQWAWTSGFLAGKHSALS